MVYIYKLVDPRNEMVRYVGKTKSQINDRFNDHWCKRYSTKSPKNSWLISLDKIGLKPKLEIIEITNDNNWEERERSWII